MEWTEAIVSNLVTIAIALLGVVVAIVVYKIDKRHRRDTNTINKLANQIKAYYELEQLYIDDMSKLNGTVARTIQQKYREVVLNSNPEIQLGGKWMSSKTADGFIRF